MSKLTDFYLGNGLDHAGRTIDQIWSWRAYNLEHRHDFIQWLFPLREQSRFNRLAPTLTDEDVAEFNASDELKHRLLKSFNVMLDFYGMAMTDLDGKVTVVAVPSCVVPGASPHWLAPHDHNFLRITRMLSCLTILGLPGHAMAMFAYLDGLYSDPTPIEKGKTAAQVIGVDTMEFWKAAVLLT